MDRLFVGRFLVSIVNAQHCIRPNKNARLAVLKEINASPMLTDDSEIEKSKQERSVGRHFTDLFLALFFVCRLVLHWRMPH